MGGLRRDLGRSWFGSPSLRRENDPEEGEDRRIASQFVPAHQDEALRRAAAGAFRAQDPVTSGYTLVQLIETSSITAHLSENTGNIYLNVFSVQGIRPHDAAMFCKKSSARTG